MAVRRRKVVFDRCFPADWGDHEDLRIVAAETSQKIHLVFLYLRHCEPYKEFWKGRQKPWTLSNDSCRILIFINGPVNQYAVLSWRTGLLDEEAQLTPHIFQLPTNSPGDWQSWLLNKLQEVGWNSAAPEKEPAAVELGIHITVPDKPTLLYDPGFLTIHPESRISRVLDKLDNCKRQFSGATSGIDARNFDSFRNAVHAILAFEGESEDTKKACPTMKELNGKLDEAINGAGLRVDRNMLPRVLLLGESGVGKTLLALYLAVTGDVTDTRSFQRIALPQYLDKEENFEYTVFGYCQGAYTDARRMGNPGFLLTNVAGVVFFDEIGDASPAIQAKLLAYLDDYCVRPCGWEGDPIYCPTMIVAATNQPIEDWLDRSREPREGKKQHDQYAPTFRRDLFERFTTVIRVPSLNERRDELHYILEGMLYIEAFNPHKRIKEIGEDAYRAISEFNYSHSNFRALENLVREACRMAGSENRTYIVESDLPRNSG